MSQLNGGNNLAERETNAQTGSERRVDGTEEPSCSDKKEKRDLGDNVIPVFRRTKDDT